MSNNFDFFSYLKSNKLGSYRLLNEGNDEQLRKIISKYVKNPDTIQSELKKYKEGGLDAVSDALAANLKRDEEFSQMDEHFDDRDAEFTAAKNPHVGMSYSKSSNYGDAMMDTVEEDFDHDSDDLEDPRFWLNSIHGEEINGWTADYQDAPARGSGPVAWTNPKYDNVLVYATPGWEGEPGIFLEIYVDDADVPAYSKDLFKNIGMWKSPKGYKRLMFQLLGWITLQLLPKLNASKSNSQNEDRSMTQDPGWQYEDELLDRMEGLANMRALELIKKNLPIVVNDWLTDGFEKEDIEMYLSNLVNRASVQQSEHFADGDGLYHAAGKEDHVDTFRTDIEELSNQEENANLAAIERFVKKSTVDYEDWDWDGETLTVFAQDGSVEKYSKEDLIDAGIIY